MKNVVEKDDWGPFGKRERALELSKHDDILWK
jgi:hypothetical protein